MISAYCWGWGNGGRSIVFWGWAESNTRAAEDTWAFVPAIVLEDVLTATRVKDLGVSVSVTDRLGAKSCTGGLQFKAVPECAAAKSAVRDKNVENHIAGLDATASRAVCDWAFASKTVAYGGVKKSCSQQEKRKIVKNGSRDGK